MILHLYHSHLMRKFCIDFQFISFQSVTIETKLKIVTKNSMCYKFKIYFISPAHNFKLDKPTWLFSIKSTK